MVNYYHRYMLRKNYTNKYYRHLYKFIINFGIMLMSIKITISKPIFV